MKIYRELIATQAAGSRQQSRFIAMMENYDRTLELTEIAQNAAGTGSLQLARSQESLETAINKLKSTWQEFYSKYLKASFFKGAVNTANKILSYFNSGNTTLKSILALTTALIVKKGITLGLDAATYAMQEKLLKGDELRTARVEQYNKHLVKSIALKKLEEKISGKKINSEEMGQGAHKDTGTLKGVLQAITNKNSARVSAGAFKANNILTGQGQFFKGKFKSAGNKTGSLFTKGLAKLAGKTGIAGDLASGLLGTLGASGTAIAGMATTIAAIPAVATLAYQSITKLLNTKYDNKAKQAVEDLNEATSKYQETLSNTTDTANKVKDFLELKEKGPVRSTEEEKEYVELQNQIAELSPDMVNYYDAEGNAVLKETEQLNDLIEAKRKNLEATRENLNAQSLKTGKYGSFDKGTSAATTFSTMVDLAAGLDTNAMETKKGWGLSKKDISTGIQELSQATSFNRVSFGKITGDIITKHQWDDMTNKIQEVFKSYNKDISELSNEDKKKILEEGLIKSKEYGQDKIDYILNMNEQLNNTLIDTFIDMADYVKEAATTQAKTQISSTMTQYAPGAKDISDFLVSQVDVGNIQDFSALKDMSFDKELASGAMQVIINNLNDAISGTDISVEEITTKVNEAVKNNESWAINLSKFLKDNELTTEELFTKYAIESQGKESSDLLKQLGEQVTKNSLSQINTLFTELSAYQDTDKQEILNKVNSILDANNVTDSELRQKLINSFNNQFNNLENTWQDSVKDIKEITEKYGKDKFQSGINFLESDEAKATLSTEQVTRIQELLSDTISEAGPEAAQVWFNNFILTIKELIKSGQIDLISQLLSTDQSDFDSINKTKKVLIKAFGEGSDAVKYFDEAIENSGDITQKKINNATEQFDKLKTKIEEVESVADSLSKAAEGTLAFSGLSDLIEKIGDEDILNLGDFVATSQGFKLRKSDYQSVLQQYQSGLQLELEQQIKDYADIIATLGENSEEAEKAQVQIANMKKALQETEAAAVYLPLKLAAQSAEELTNKLKDTYDRLKDIVDLLEDFDKWEDIENLSDVLDTQFSEYEATLDLNLNVEINKGAIKKQVQLLNKQIATERAKKTAANSDLDFWTKQAQDSGYWTIGTDGNIAKTQKYINLINSANGASETQLETIKSEIEQADKFGEQYKNAYEKLHDATNKEVSLLKQLQQIQNEALSQMSNLSKTLLDIMINNDEKELEDYQSTVDKKKEALQDYLNAVQDSINKERNMRDLADKEEDLRQKERKLSILQMDTSGLYASDIASLQEEISNDRRDLEDSYVDKYITDLSNEIDKQSEAYERDITAWEDYLEWKKEDMIMYQDEVDMIISQGADYIANYINTKSTEITGMTTQQLESFKAETYSTVTLAISYYESLADNGIQLTLDALDSAKENTTTLEEATNTFAENAKTDYEGVSGNIATVSDSITSLVSNINSNLIDAWNNAADALAKYNAQALELERIKNQEKEFGSNYSGISQKLPTGSSSDGRTRPLATGNENYLKTANSDLVLKTDVGSYLESKPFTGYATYDIGNGKYVIVNPENIVYEEGSSKRYIPKGSQYFEMSKESYRKNRTKLSAYLRSYGITKAFKTGGYVDYTGPAWVDGTPTKPEAFLNSADTARMESLIGVLQQLDTKSSYSKNHTTENKPSNNNFSITINVDELNDEYDVEKLAEDIQDIIYNNMTKNKVVRA